MLVNLSTTPGYPDDAEAVLIVELDGLRETVDEHGHRVRDICHSNNASEIREAEDDAKRAELWATRKGAIGAFGTIAPNYYLVDGVVPRTKATGHHAPSARDRRGTRANHRQRVPRRRRQSAPLHSLRR